MTNINWAATMRFDPNLLTQTAEHGIPVPTYGNYGGVNYSAGQVGGTTPEAGSAAYLAHPPKDALDQLFYAHDLVYQHYENGTATLNQTFEADATLVQGMSELPQLYPGLFASDPEVQLYDAFATLGILGKIATTPTESQYLQTTLPPPEQQLLAGQAVQNFEAGLALTSGAESRGLHGALHVFEAHFSDFLLV